MNCRATKVRHFCMLSIMVYCPYCKCLVNISILAIKKHIVVRRVFVVALRVSVLSILVAFARICMSIIQYDGMYTISSRSHKPNKFSSNYD